MKFILLAIVFVFVGCTHNSSRTVSTEGSDLTCGLQGTIESRIQSCSWANEIVKSPQDFVLVAQLYGKDKFSVSSSQEYSINKTHVFKDVVTGLLWTTPTSFSGSLEQAIDFCPNNPELNQYFSGMSWRLPTDQEILTIFNKRSPSTFHDIHDRVLGLKRNNSTNMIKYYDYHLKGAQMMSMAFNSKDAVILCVADN